MVSSRRHFLTLIALQLAGGGCKKRPIDRAPDPVELTVDADVETLAKRVLRDYLRRPLRQMHDFDAGMVTVRNLDSAVLAYVGTLRDDVQFDNCRFHGRDLGSVGKPFILGAALQYRRIGANERFPDIPFTFQRFDANGTYAVHNHGDRYSGRNLDVCEALPLSSNTVYTQIYSRVGPSIMRRVFADLKLGSDFNVNLMPVGRWSAPLTDVAAAFTVFPNEGVFRRARFVASEAVRSQTVFRPEVCRVVSAAMGRCITSGTGIAARDLGASCRGKTGSASDAIAVLQSRVITSIIWLGHTRSNKDLRMTGGQVAMPALAEYYRELSRLRSDWFPYWRE